MTILSSSWYGCDKTNGMQICSDCFQTLVTPDIDVGRSFVLEKLRWESGPASVNPEEVALSLGKVHRDMETCESEIHDRCTNCTTVWTTHREHLQAYAEEVQSLLSPVRKIPDEILHYIFDYCCETNHFISPNRHCDLRDTPASALSGVCSRWRRNGLSISILWSRIFVEITEDLEEGRRTEDDEKLFLALDCFLTRSLPSPLDLTVRLHEGALDENFDVHPILARLMDHTHRWCSFSYQSEHYILPTVFSNSLAQSKFPFLEKLEIEDAVREELDWFIHMTPKLKSLTLLGSIRLGAIDDDLQLFFDGCPNFASLTIEEEVLRSGIPMFAISSLESLSIWHGRDPSDEYERPGRSLFKSFDFPSLRHMYIKPSLHFTPHNTSNWVNFDHFLEFIKRSSFSLTTLSIQSLALSDSQLLIILVYVPTLINLSFDDTDVPTEDSAITSHFVESLHCHCATPATQSELSPIVSKLRSLTLNVGASSFDDALVVDMVRSRWLPCDQSGENSTPSREGLREFLIRFRNREVVVGVYDLLERMKKHGMRVAVLWKV